MFDFRVCLFCEADNDAIVEITIGERTGARCQRCDRIVLNAPGEPDPYHAWDLQVGQLENALLNQEQAHQLSREGHQDALRELSKMLKESQRLQVKPEK